MNAKNNAAHVAVQAEPCLNSDSAACKRLFGGRNPEEVILPLHTAADALEWVKELFKTIAQEPEISARIRKLAGMGAYLAEDMSNFAGCEHEEMMQAIKDGGVA